MQHHLPPPSVHRGVERHVRARRRHQIGALLPPDRFDQVTLQVPSGDGVVAAAIVALFTDSELPHVEKNA
ncbi:hypothetical protein [Kribbella pittospori]|uniref:hypothetical protein n=1 Tax=Kribbella pittospori TaxID=722689 RepID=UPI00192DBE5E|nr:hypothetical protein [Kribbella pittospori]